MRQEEKYMEKKSEIVRNGKSEEKLNCKGLKGTESKET